ncbi:hypothetical protein GobsT_14070 [Gemmata obscuriglobus]|uniref:Uncharacterized protein n=1 Tax=Gemmata obscuriglobus TaxID=114 RepID=A0A2Z3H959_9BACT|nr:hypothetical protein [Gemmata obscuriglobus]AWM40156.1 hypothetical protein C1280_26235 [Gemmata obscuriglobus]QEG26662.1 hypothetical protein GobsT_14070 [Gemmata obscuriglobus]VTS02274.1 unnamed protein product [Gemmata obscuriglobus UQM 2246]
MSEAKFGERVKDVRRILAEVAPGAAPVEDDEPRPFACGRVGHRAQIAVTFARKDGRAKTLAYSHLYCLDTDNPNLGCVLEFTRHRVTVQGRNLAELVRLLGDHKVREVCQTDEMHALALGPNVPVVTTLEVRGKRAAEEC